MASINAATAGGGGVITTSDATGNLNIQSAGSTVVAVTAAGATVTGTLAATGAVTASTTLAVTGASTFTGTGKFATTIGVGNATPAASGSGITFPATQSASSDANTLDDYEEGTATLTLTAGTTPPTSPPTATATYTKIGKVVNLAVVFANVSNAGAAGTVLITGLPFVSISGTPQLGSIVNSRGPSSFTTAYIPASSTQINQVDYTGASVNWASFGTGVYLFVTITYQTS